MTQEIINKLQANWVWVPDWNDHSSRNTVARIVTFRRFVRLTSLPTKALLHFTADTRYKLNINGTRAAIGPARSSHSIWYYDSLDIAPLLRVGDNEICFIVIRYFAASRGGMPFERTAYPGITVISDPFAADDQSFNFDSLEGWQAEIDDTILFPKGLLEDGFLHISERVNPAQPAKSVSPVPYNFNTLNGELPPWRLRPRCIPLPEQTRVTIGSTRNCEGDVPSGQWLKMLSGDSTLTLSQNSSYNLDILADVHSTAFPRWSFTAARTCQIRLKITYSEGYEYESPSYPFFRHKGDRLDSINGHIVGPHDDVLLNIPANETVVYEPFWFRTFRVMRWEIETRDESVDLISFAASQVNYPLAVKASWYNADDDDSKGMWDVSIRTLRNCMFDGYSDCPFYEQLQYSGDSRSVGLFHYLLSGDDRLMRQCISNFASSVTPEGLTQSRFPSHVPQLIAGFPLYWILQVCDHHLFFGDTAYARSFVPKIDGVLDFFDRHIDSLGLVSGLPEDVWQYVDWVTTWGATREHPDKGVPTSGRKSNRHTFFSMLYAFVLKQAARLVRDVGRPGHAEEYISRAASVVAAIQKHCFDGEFFTDSTADIADSSAYSQHCQVFGVLCDAVAPGESARLITSAFEDPGFSKCSYVMKFYALRAFALAGDGVYESAWTRTWEPWRRMLNEYNLTSWEEDDVRQRSDCHAWGSVPIYEYCVELAGLHILEPGARKVLFKPRLKLSRQISAVVALGSDNTAEVEWHTTSDGSKNVNLIFKSKVHLISQLPGQDKRDHGSVCRITLLYSFVE
ncbi:unnamed protein product [Clonostachys byssicola]|uniref:Alpha-L-rhamnosidase six-hairpin glycosidase domain-containing protein n=1 Tax=Clonostachys byssicola TaxID=160290 RepID=A0A9N9Y9M8_9HYPO|nr:unnamed protein product [Clonostachys byssicola]